MIALTAALLALSGGVAESRSLEGELDALAHAWRSGSLTAAARHAVSALDLIEASACPLRSDAAIAAAIGGLANSGDQRFGPPGYLFWVAHEVNSRIDVLPSEIAESAIALKTSPGADVREDAYFLASAYRRIDGLEDDCAPARLDATLFTSEPDAAEAVIAVIEWPRYRDSLRWSSVQMLFAYPRDEGAQLVERIGAMDGRVRPQGRHRVLAFEPCETFSNADLGMVRLCREDPAP